MKHATDINLAISIGSRVRMRVVLFILFVCHIIFHEGVSKSTEHPVFLGKGTGC